MPDDAGERLLTGRAGRLSLTLALGLFGINIARQALPPLLPRIIEDLAISPSTAGFALTVMWGAFALLQYPAGRLSDRLSRRTVLVGALLVAMLAGWTLLSAQIYLMLLAGTALLGAGAGAYIVSMRPLLSDLYVEKRGQALGINQAAGNVGSVVAAGVAIVALSIGTWQSAFVPVIVLVAAATVGLHVWSREPYVVERVELDVLGGIRRVFGTREMRWLVASYTLVILTWNGVLGFLPTFLQVEKAFSPTLAGASFAIPYVVGIVAMPFAGGLSDRFDRLRVAAVASALSGIGLGLLTFAGSVPVIVVGIVVFAAGLMAYPPVMQAHLMDAFPADEVGGNFGAFRTVYMFIAALGPTYVGVAAERLSYVMGFASIALGLFLSAAIVVGLMAWRR